MSSFRKSSAFTATHLRDLNMTINCQKTQPCPFPYCTRSSRNIRSSSSIQASVTSQLKAAEAARLLLAFLVQVYHAVRIQQLPDLRNLLILESSSLTRSIRIRGLNLMIKLPCNQILYISMKSKTNCLGIWYAYSLPAKVLPFNLVLILRSVIFETSIPLISTRRLCARVVSRSLLSSVTLHMRW